MAYSPNPQLVEAIRNAPAHLRDILLATALVESGGRLDAVGDGGNSFGPYQFNRAGRLASAGFTPQQAQDPRLATQATVNEFQTFYDRGARGADLAYRAQRPADQGSYMSKINDALGAAREILGGASSAGSGVTNEAHLAQAGSGSAAPPPPGASPSPQQFSYGPSIPRYAQRDPSAYARRMLAMGQGDAGMMMNLLRGGSPYGRFATQMSQPQAQQQNQQASQGPAPDGSSANDTGYFNPFPGGNWAGGPDAHGARALGNWQSDNAWDVMGKAGDVVYAVSGGTVPRISNPGNSPQFAGHGVYLNDANGREWWYRHIDPLVEAGATIRAGQPIGRLAGNTQGGPHLHLAVNQGDPQRLLGLA